MRIWALIFTCFACACAQQMEFLNQRSTGLVARDPGGNWIFAEKGRLRKLSADFSQTRFDIAAPTDTPLAAKSDADGNTYVLTATSFLQIGLDGKLLANTNLAPSPFFRA